MATRCIKPKWDGRPPISENARWIWRAGADYRAADCAGDAGECDCRHCGKHDADNADAELLMQMLHGFN